MLNHKLKEQDLIDRLKKYIIEAIYSEYITDKYFHLRNAGSAERNILKNKSISMIGCGALGSEIADCLAKAGIGNISLIDKGTFRYHNAVRHILPITRTGVPKTFGLIEHVVLHNPFVTKNSLFVNDICEININKYIPNNFIGISTIADDNIEGYLNEEAVENNKTVFYIRALRGGKAGRIFRVIPNKDACKKCLGLYKIENNPIFTDIPEDTDLPEITNECNNPVRAGSAADLKIISSIASRVIIDYLEGRNTDKNHWVWTTEKIFKNNSADISYKLTNSFIPPNENCSVCKKIEEIKVFISEDAYQVIKNECQISKNLETGGILLGYIDATGDYNIVKASEPGPNVKKTPTRFEKDIKFCNKVLTNSIKKIGEKGMYIGEWHYHPEGSNEPSGLDIKSLTEIATQNNYRIEKPILLIVSQKYEFGITIHDKTGRCIRLEIIKKDYKGD